LGGKYEKGDGTIRAKVTKQEDGGKTLKKKLKKRKNLCKRKGKQRKKVCIMRKYWEYWKRGI
jgi:hypothetical protein